MTYKELKQAIELMSEDEQNLDVSVYQSTIDETYRVVDIVESDEEIATALDEGHPVLVIEADSRKLERPELTQILVKLAESKNYRIYHHYSGRGMFGATVTAIVVPNLACIPNWITGYSWDNMGNEYVIYYK